MAVRKAWQQAFEDGAAGVGGPVFFTSPPFLPEEPLEFTEYTDEPEHLGEVQHTPERHTEPSAAPPAPLALGPVSQEATEG